jgi:hypothetical protein
MSKPLNAQKLRLEIEELKKTKTWSIRHILEKILPAYIPSAVAILALVTAYNNGLFEVKAQKLELEKKQLEYDIAIFRRDEGKIIAEKDSLYALTQLQKAKLEQMTAVARKLLLDAQSVTKEANTWAKQIDPKNQIQWKVTRISNLNNWVQQLGRSIISADQTTVRVDSDSIRIH